jgi:outer membrane protein assembly factor BamE
MLNSGRLPIIVIILSLSACSYNGSINLPGLYRVDVQQGNVLDQSMLDKLRPGMDKNQVEFILGTPAIVDPFHTDQWEYFFSMTEDGEDRKQRHLRVHFVDEKLAYIDGDVVVTNRDLTDPIRQSRTVDVPADRQRNQGIFSRMINAIPFVGDDPPRRNESPDANEEAAPSEEPDSSE